MDDDDDALLVEASDAIERQVGGGSVATDRYPGRFVFRLDPVTQRPVRGARTRVQCPCATRETIPSSSVSHGRLGPRFPSCHPVPVGPRTH